MTSLSAYASRFLSTGASTATNSNQQPQQHNNQGGSTIFKNSLYQPFTSSQYAANEHGIGGEDDVDDEEDNVQTSSRRRGVGQRHLPHLQNVSKSRSGITNLSTSSRFLANLGGGGTSGRGRRSDVRDMADELNEDDEDEERSMYQNQRGKLALSEEQRTPNASVIGRTRDERDPFLAEDDLQRSSSNRSRSQSPITHLRGPSNEEKARGWLARGTDSSSAASETPIRHASARRQRRTVLPDDIYRDPDATSAAEDEEDGYVNSAILQQGRRHSSRPRQSHRRTNPAVSTDEEDDDDTSHISSSDESQFDPKEARFGTWRAGGRASRTKRTTQGGGGSSSLREPLLSSVGSEGMEDNPPGAFSGVTTRMASADIYAYPHPPAKSGWTPWAPGNRVPLSQYKDKVALLSWCGFCAVTLFIAGWMAIGAKSVSPPSSPSTRPSPYYTLTRSIPVLFLLTFLSLVAATANLLVLRNISRVGGAKVLRYGLIGIPMVLAFGWMWAFAGSFIYEDEKWNGGQWSTTGLRILSIIPLALAIYFARNVWKKRESINRSLSVLEISASIVAKHPVLLLLSISSLLFFIIITAPFLTIFTRLFLRGHFGGGKVWETDSNARFMAWITLGSWIWTWLVLRGVQRVTVAGVVSHWYFHREEEGESGKLFDAQDEEQEESLPEPAPGQWLGEEQMTIQPPTHVDIVRASFIRATGSALGTICLSAFLLSMARVGTMIAASARWGHHKLSTSSRVPAFMQPLTYVVALLAGLSAILQGLSDYALVYVGVTGDGFAAAARRSARLTGRQGVKTVMEGLVINMLLDLTTLALCFLCGLTGFLISAHNLHVPADAPLVGLLCALMPYATLRLCADVLSNAADTLYLCFSIDQASGEEHCKEASEAFLKGNESLPF